MSKIGNHRIGIQESYSYQLGWEAAEKGRPQLPEADKIRADWRLGWHDYHNQEQSK